MLRIIVITRGPDLLLHCASVLRKCFTSFLLQKSKLANISNINIMFFIIINKNRYPMSNSAHILNPNSRLGELVPLPKRKRFAFLE